jgi:hypothetical protein
LTKSLAAKGAHHERLRAQIVLVERSTFLSATVDLGESSPLNSDQARELAAALLEAAAEIDGWAGR